MRFKKNRVTRDLENFKKIVAESVSIREVRKKLNYRESGGIYVYLKHIFEYFKIDISHFTGQQWSKGKTKETDERLARAAEYQRLPWEKVFTYNSGVENGTLLKRLIEANKKEYKCEICELSSWKNKPIRLQIDHINGDRLDNREENLRIICPNCHSQTDTFARGLKSKQLNRLEPWWYSVSCPGYVSEYCNPRKSNEWRKKPRLKQRKVNRPTKKELTILISDLPWVAIGRKYGVSDNAVRKWARSYGIL